MRVLSWNHGERQSQNCSGRQWGLGDFGLEVLPLRWGDRGDPNPVTKWSGAAASYSVPGQTITLDGSDGAIERKSAAESTTVSLPLQHARRTHVVHTMRRTHGPGPVRRTV
jgi:hypothetical protein